MSDSDRTQLKQNTEYPYLPLGGESEDETTSRIVNMLWEQHFVNEPRNANLSEAGSSSSSRKSLGKQKRDTKPFKSMHLLTSIGLKEVRGEKMKAILTLFRQYGSASGKIFDLEEYFLYSFSNECEMNAVLDFIDDEKMLWIHFKNKLDVKFTSL